VISSTSCLKCLDTLTTSFWPVSPVVLSALCFCISFLVPFVKYHSIFIFLNCRIYISAPSILLPCTAPRTSSALHFYTKLPFVFTLSFLYSFFAAALIFTTAKTFRQQPASSRLHSAPGCSFRSLYTRTKKWNQTPLDNTQQILHRKRTWPWHPFRQLSWVPIDGVSFSSFLFLSHSYDIFTRCCLPFSTFFFFALITDLPFFHSFLRNFSGTSELEHPHHHFFLSFIFFSTSKNSAKQKTTKKGIPTFG
jgi:hypothetical protein